MENFKLKTLPGITPANENFWYPLTEEEDEQLGYPRSIAPSRPSKSDFVSAGFCKCSLRIG